VTWLCMRCRRCDSGDPGRAKREAHDSVIRLVWDSARASVAVGYTEAASRLSPSSDASLGSCSALTAWVWCDGCGGAECVAVALLPSDSTRPLFSPTAALVAAREDSVRNVGGRGLTYPSLMALPVLEATLVTQVSECPSRFLLLFPWGT
jgi:hypothetical protein